MRALRNRRSSRVGAVLLALAVVAGSVAGLWLSTSASSAQSDTGDAPSSDDFKVLAAALGVTTHASKLVSDNSVPSNLGMTPQSLAASAAAAAADEAALMAQLDAMSGRGYDDRVDRIRTLVNRLVGNTKQIMAGRPALLGTAIEGRQSLTALLARGYPLLSATNTSVDNEFYDLMGPELKWSFQDDVRVLSARQAAEVAATSVMTQLASSLVLDRPELLGLVQENHVAAANALRQAVNYLSQNDSDDINPAVIQLSQWMLQFGDESFFEAEDARLQLVAAEAGLIADNARTLAQLSIEIDALSAVLQGMTPPALPPLTGLAGGTPGVTDTAIHFGQSAALTGPSSVLGQGMKQGIEAAFAEANRAGGVHGRQLRLTTLDDSYESQIAFENTVRLIQADRVFGLIGAVGTPTARATAPVAGASGTPFVGPLTGADFLRDSDQAHVVNFRASYHQETEQMVKRLVNDLGVTRVAVLYQNDSYGLDGLEGVRRALERRELEIVASGYYRRNTSAIKTAALQIAEAQPEAVILVTAHAPAAEAIKLLRDTVEPDPVLMAVSFVDSGSLAEDLGDEGEGVYVTQVAPLPYDFDSRAAGSYRAALKALDPDAELGYVSLEGYLVGRMAIAGLEACGRDLTRACFLGAFGGGTTIGIDEIQLTFGAGDNQGSNEVRLSQLGSDGRFGYVSRVTR